MGEGSELDDVSDQEIIRQQYEEWSDDLRRAEDEVTACEDAIDELRKECAHPNMGKGKDICGFDVPPNECPDCGFYKEA